MFMRRGDGSGRWIFRGFQEFHHPLNKGDNRFSPFFHGCLRGFASGDQNQIESFRKAMLFQSVRLPQHSSQAMADNGIPMPAGNAQPNACCSERIAGGKQQEDGISRFDFLRINPLKIQTAPNSPPSGK